MELNFHFATHTADSPRHILAIKKITFMFLMMMMVVVMTMAMAAAAAAEVAAACTKGAQKQNSLTR